MNSRWVKSESILDGNHGDNDNNHSDRYQTPSLPKPGGPLKPRMDAVGKKIEVLTVRLEELHRINRAKDSSIFTKLMLSVKENNIQHLNLLSSELLRTRQVSRALLLTSVALEKLVAKLSLASDFGDVVTILSPSMAVVKSLRSSITPYVHDMEAELGIISELLSGILVDAGQVGGFTINFENANEEGVRLLEEVSELVDQKMREDYPKVPELPALPVRFS